MVRWIVEVSDETSALESSLLSAIERAVRTALAEEAAGDVEISVALLDDDAISRLNRDFLSHDGPADVISFPLRQPGLRLVGDIYIGVDQARRQAGEYGVAPEEELVRLAIHGTLHVLGWDHPDGDDRIGSPMYQRQEELLRLIAG